MPPPIRRSIVSCPEYPFSPTNAPIKLDQNESAEDFPAHLKKLVLDQLADVPWNRYTDLHCKSLCAAIGEYENWLPEGIVVANGSNVLIPLLVQLAGLEGRVVTVKPNFSLYGLSATLLGADLTEVPLRNDLSLDMQLVIDALSQRADDSSNRGVIYIPRPHVPTGGVTAPGELEKLADAAKDWLLVVDEAYHQYAPTNVLNALRDRSHVVVLRTFSKAWGLAGLRLGYALTSVNVARQLRKLAPPFAVSVMQQVAIRVALANSDYMSARVSRTIAERERILAALSDHPQWRAFPSSANFLLIRTPDATKAFEWLLEKGIAVRQQNSQFALSGCIRVTVGSEKENDAFLSAAMEWLKEEYA